MKYKIGLAFIVAAIGLTMVALAQVSVGHTHMGQASGGPAFHFHNLQPVY